jgi:muconate cycloisomerase|tara:strand:+ start:1773 stop:2939 length:1167 start_codon:yes stop_codon:yes gene_type:complete
VNGLPDAYREITMSLLVGVVDRMTVSIVDLPVVSKRSHGIGDVANRVRNVILKLETKDGLVGWGEASPWPVFTGSVEGTSAALDVYFRPLVIGQNPMHITAVMEATEATLVGHFEAKAALEMALYDLVGKAVGLPVSELLGGRCRSRIPLSISLANPDFAADLELAKRVYADGLRILKVKMGFSDHRFDLDRLQVLREELPSDMEIRVDYNQGMKPYEALKRLRDIEVFQPGFIEQPVPAKEWTTMTELTSKLDTPVMADESVFSPVDAIRAVERRIANCFSIKVMKSGGMRHGQEVATVANAGGIGCYGGDMFETGLAHLAGVHMIAATPNISLGCEFYQASYYLKQDLLTKPFPLENGEVVVPETPGLGIDVDSDRLKEFIVDSRG